MQCSSFYMSPKKMQSPTLANIKFVFVPFIRLLDLFFCLLNCLGGTIQYTLTEYIHSISTIRVFPHGQHRFKFKCKINFFLYQNSFFTKVFTKKSKIHEGCLPHPQFLVSHLKRAKLSFFCCLPFRYLQEYTRKTSYQTVAHSSMQIQAQYLQPIRSKSVAPILDTRGGRYNHRTQLCRYAVMEHKFKNCKGPSYKLERILENTRRTPSKITGKTLHQN